MRARLENELNVHVATFSHPPGARVDRIARRLASLVNELPRRSRVHLVGHSLGGLVARWYVQEHGGHERVTQTISMASPFFGAPAANRFPFLVGRDLRTESTLLSRLRARAHEHGVPHTSIVAERDTVVTPNGSACFPAGEVVVLPGIGHNSLLFDEAAISHVVSRIASRRA
jgi:pimeloyl-ACP methyl ester carboxylesterase